MFGGGGGGPDPNVDNTALYEVLGLDSNCSDADIKKAWRRAAVAHHPDRGGDTKMFQKCQQANEILSDPEKREQYDRYGDKFLNGEAGGGGGGDMEDMLRQMFGGGGGQRQRGPPRGKDVGVRYSVSLEELYTGVTKEFDWQRKNICSVCNGLGGPADAKETCTDCEGRGVKIQVVRMGPMVTQQRVHCGSCEGHGHVMDKARECKPCGGVGVVVEDRVLIFDISPGMNTGDKIKMSEEGDKVIPEMIPGDVYIVVEVDEHDDFERRGDHLVYEKQISLLESLTGFKFTMTTLDGRTLEIESANGEVFHPGMLKMISGEGMPTHRNPVLKGLLLIRFDVVFPERMNMDIESYKSLSALLPAGDHTHPMYTDSQYAGKSLNLLEDVSQELLNRLSSDQYEDGNDDQQGQPCHVQ